MAFGQFQQGESAAMSEINVTPLVDVMLVLLVVFILTTPLFTNSVALELPKAKADATQDTKQPIRLNILADGSYNWNGQALASEAALVQTLRQLAKTQPDASIQLNADKNAKYDAVAKALAAAQQNGLSKIAFITQAEE